VLAKAVADRPLAPQGFAQTAEAVS